MTLGKLIRVGQPITEERRRTKAGCVKQENTQVEKRKIKQEIN